MLLLSPTTNGDCEEQGEFNLQLEDIDFDDLFVGFDDGDLLPDLELDPAEILAEFSVGESQISTTAAPAAGNNQEKVCPEAEAGEDKGSEVMSVSMESGSAPTGSSSSSETESRSRKPSTAQTKSSGKRKVKVDWTPELHRRFVQAVEQLGVDKAVPSRILELMGIDCLTRHNIASHLQKYRSHRKHLLAREAEAASWSQRRQMYANGGGGPAAKRNISHPWVAPTMGFPPAPVPAFRPLHVWGHPSTVDQAPVWPKHIVRAPTRPHWVPPQHLPPPTPEHSYWHHHYHPRVSSTMAQGTPFFPHPVPPARFPAPPQVPMIPPHPMYRPSYVAPPPSKNFAAPVPLEAHPAKESIDAAIGDVLSQPWKPLPLGLKPPSLESVMGELQRQGVSNIPPTCS